MDISKINIVWNGNPSDVANNMATYLAKFLIQKVNKGEIKIENNTITKVSA